ncbi:MULTISPECIES: SPFH domain-containing protein [Streptomyces]|uniref:SPFH domain-containing protein n=1 Tax=Streptomyces TaxID=1883 RepID=UPI0022598C71|nr:SPFH domain-containing protein [Streptomyces sp. NBC_00160]MCX5305884.1 SPFH domain-containing protein [Streptomyces sp. NBC_00160]
MFPTRTTSTTGTLRVPPAAAPAAVRADPTPAPASAPAPEPASAPAPRSVGAAQPVPTPAPAPAPVPAPDPMPVPVPEPASAPHSEWAAQPVPAPALEPVHAAVAVAVPREAVPPGPPPALLGSPAAAEHAVAAETSFGWAAAPPARPAPEPPHGWEVPAARAHPYDEGDQGATDPAAAMSLDIPHPQDAEPPAGVATLRLRTAGAGAEAEAVAEPEPEPAPVDAPVDAAPPPHFGIPEPEPMAAFEPEPEPEPESGPEPAAPHSGIPGPGPVEIVAQAVARGLDEGAAAPDLPRPGAAQRGASVTQVPVHLPFRGTQQLPAAPAPAPAPASAATACAARAPRPAPGRRVPRGDDRLREHRGPVLPGWVGVAVGGIALAGCVAVLWRAGVVPAPFVAAFGAAPRAYHGLRATHWPPLAFLGIVALVSLGGLGRSRTGHAWVLTLFGRYRGTVRRTGLTWVSPLLLRRRIDVRLRHWRSDPMPAVDSGGLALQVVVQVVWQVRDTARATLAVEDHTEYLAEQVESAMARVLSQLPADAFHEDAPTLRDAEAVGDALTRMLAAETEAVGIEVFSAQPTRIEYAAEVAEAMRRRRVAAIDAKHRDTVLTSVVDAVDDTVHRLTSRGLVELDDYERKALVKDLTVAFYTGRAE